MGTLHVLPGRIANLIAAGEVIQRPASVVKELMENAVDAGAASVTVIISDAGRTLIKVIDDGCGMSAPDAVLCFERHATSKIEQAEDLSHISTFGFRGEALASIAAVAEVTLTTRRESDEVGTCVTFSESKMVSKESVSCPAGTSFEVRNIFYNLPARRKFLKSNNAEMAHITNEFLRIALTRKDIRFTLVHGGKELFVLSPVQNIKQRILTVTGRELTNRLVDISTDTRILNVSGFVGTPESARKAAANQYFFINGRFFRSPYLHKAVCRAYLDLVPDGYTPPYFIFLEADLEQVDVNIHPTKTEIKFEDESTIFQIVNSVVREALGRSSFAPSIDFDNEGAPDIPVNHPRDHTYVAPPKINYDPLFNPFIQNSFEKAGPAVETIGSYSQFKGSIPEAAEPQPKYYGRIVEDSFEDRPVLCVQDKFIVTNVKSGLLLIDIRRARCRILFERYMASLEKQQPVTQQSLFPHRIELPGELYSVIADNIDKVSLFGFDIQDLGAGTIAVTGIPDGYIDDESTIRGYIDDLIELLREGDIENDFTRSVAVRLARSGAASSGRINFTEAQILVDTLFACQQPQTTPDGRKCMTIINLEQLEDLL